MKKKENYRYQNLNRDQVHLSSLEEFQQEISMMMAKKKAQSKKKNKQNKEKLKQKQNKVVKFPSLYEKKNLMPIIQALERKTESFHQKIQDLEVENAIQQSVNKRLIQYLERSRDNQQNMGYQGNGNNYMMPYTQQVPNMPNIHNNNKDTNNYQRRRQPQQQQNFNRTKTNTSFNHKPSLAKKITPKKRFSNIQLLHKFKVAAIAVYFMVIFPKYSYIHTTVRYHKFCLQWYKNKERLEKMRQRLYHLMKKNIEGEIFKNGGNKFDKVKQINNNKKKNTKEESQTVELQLDNYTTVKFITDSLEILNKSFASVEFSEKLLMIFANMGTRQFIPDNLVQEKDSKFLKINPNFGYNEFCEKMVLSLIAKEIYGLHFMRKHLFQQIGHKILEKSDNPKNKQAYFSMVIRNAIFQNIVKLYLSVREEDLPTVVNKPDKKMLPAFSQNFKRSTQSELDMANIIFEKTVIQQIANKYLGKNRDDFFNVMNAGVNQVHNQIKKYNLELKKKIKESILLNTDKIFARYRQLSKQQNFKEHYYVSQRKSIGESSENMYLLLFPDEKIDNDEAISNSESQSAPQQQQQSSSSSSLQSQSALSST